MPGGEDNEPDPSYARYLTSLENRVKLLTARKETLFRRIQNAYDMSKFKNDNSPTDEKAKRSFKISCVSLDDTKRQFEKVLDEINNHKLELNEEPNYLELNSFDDLYCAVKQVQNELENETAANKPSNSAVSGNESSDMLEPKGPKLPPIEIPKFDGKELNWAFFYHNFKSLVVDNKKLSDDVKARFLSGALLDKALALVSGISPTGDNFKTMWETLCKRYADPRVLASKYLNTILKYRQSLKESPEMIDNFLQEFAASAQAFLNLKLNDPVNFLLYHIATLRLPPSTIRQFELSLFSPHSSNNKNITVLPGFQELFSFLQDYVKILSHSPSSYNITSTQFNNNNKSVNEINPRSTFNKAGNASNNYRSSSNRLFNASRFNANKQYNVPTQSYISKQGHNTNFNLSKCPICLESNHKLVYHCHKFKNISVKDRLALVDKHNLCKNCLSNFHLDRNCRSKNNCVHCKLYHHSLLCENINNRDTIKSIEIEKPLDQPVSVVAASRAVNPLSCQTVLLSTAQVYVYNNNNKAYLCRALLDSASQSNFVSQSLCEKLNVSKRPVITNIQGIGAQSSTVQNECTVTFSSRFDNKIKYDLRALVIDQITDFLPSCDIPLSSLTHLKNLSLADETYHISGEIDLLIGASLFANILKSGKISASPNSPLALETSLGYVVMGPVNIEPSTSNNTDYQSYCNIVSQPLDKLVARMWELEDIPNPSSEKMLTSEEEDCERLFSETTKRTPEGRFGVNLPFSKNQSLLGESKTIALRRLKSLEKRFLINPNLREEYNKFMNDYLVQGHMSVGEENNSGCYLPHHCVLKPSSTSTKLRVVWDASCKTSSGCSLNDILSTGPKLHNDIINILTKFRFYKIAITADIKQMYRQILVNNEHRIFQKILWRFSSEEKVQVYTLNTVTFGVKPAPYLALRVLAQISQSSINSHPVASDIIKNNFFIDDLAYSCSTLNEAKIAHTQLIEILKQSGFDLVKWNSNSQTFLNALPPDIRLNEVINFDNTDNTKILGLQYNPSIDKFMFSLENTNKECTKRNILSTYARIYDPLGFLAPVTVSLKLLIKEFWNSNLYWDQIPTDSKLINAWSQIQNQLPLLSKIYIPRYLGLNSDSSIDLIGFADASAKAYGCVVYSKVNIGDKNVISLICAKTKVAPMKPISIPRLELSAAVLLSRLLNFVKNSFQTKVKINRIFAFSDSTVTLCWIASKPTRWKIFIANRVKIIHDMIPTAEWRHVQGVSNPADCLSRGVSPKDFLNHTLWYTGPEWLYLHYDNWPASIPSSGGEELIEEKKLVLTVTQTENNIFTDIIQNSSCYDSILRIVAIMFRWTQYKRHIPTLPYFTAVELNKAEITVLKSIQLEHFKDEIENLEYKKSLSSRFRKLQPFLGDHGLYVVGGRLAHSNLSYQQKHQILLPSNSRLVHLLIDKYHATYFHTGANTTLALLRQKYWICGGRNIVKKRIAKCNLCFKHRPRPTYPLMGSLPKERVTECKAFLQTGVDYAGPYNIIFSKKRGVRTHKAYLCLFICLTTKAVHLELASDLTALTFLNALKRFISRRGPIHTIHSDGGTNFLGARNHLDKIYNLLISKDFKYEYGRELSNHRINWKQLVPSAPHMAGIWESNIKSAKSIIAKVLGNNIMTYEELNTVFIQVEALLNSRPLCVLSSDPHDLKALTPASFLLQDSIDHFPSPEYNNIPMNRLTRYQLIEKIIQDFWKRWHIEYLHTLQSREKWNRTNNPIAVGTIVIVKYDNQPPLQWPLAIVEEVHPGKDGIVRVVTIRSKGKLYRRPVVKLCPLPTQ